ncbi:Uncharacterised protein [Mycobacterium tuberculosis]|nr:Uncharacterised protein [Mycobacterium tuberculosis]
MGHPPDRIQMRLAFNSLFNLPLKSLIACDGQGLLHLWNRIHFSEERFHFGNQIGGNLLVPPRCRSLYNMLNFGDVCAVKRSHGSPRNVSSQYATPKRPK